MKKIIVLSLGGSLIVPGKVDDEFLKGFKKVLLKHTKKYKFVVVCGGGWWFVLVCGGLWYVAAFRKAVTQNLSNSKTSLTHLNPYQKPL